MPLIRKAPDAGTPSSASVGDAAGTLRSVADPGQRRQAARALASRPDAVPDLAAALGSESEPAVREAIFASLTAIGGEGAVQALVAALRTDDAGLRNGALEALRSMPEAVQPHLPRLLADDDCDVRILATELARGLPAGDATAVLCAMLARETQPNACGAALDVLTEVGTPNALPTLRTVAARFASDPFVPFAAQVAIARIEGAGD